MVLKLTILFKQYHYYILLTIFEIVRKMYYIHYEVLNNRINYYDESEVYFESFVVSPKVIMVEIKNVRQLFMIFRPIRNSGR